MSGEHAKKEIVTSGDKSTSHGKAPSGESHNKKKEESPPHKSHRSGDKKKKQSKRKSSNEHNKSLSLITKTLCGIGRGFDHFGVSCIEC